MVAQVGMITYPAGNGKIIKFDQFNYLTTDSTYKMFVQGNQPKQGQYVIVADTSVNMSISLIVSSGQFTKRIILNNDTTSDKIFYQITNTKLVILSGFFPTDGGLEMTYERQ